MTAEAFQAFYAEQIPRLRRLAYRLTGDWHQADELAQDAMVRAYRAWDRIEDDPGVYVRRVLVNLHRSKLRRALVEAKHLFARATPAADDAPAPEERAAIWAELAKLPPKQRVALVLHFYEDMQQKDIAEVLGCPAGTVNSLVHRGLARLRERLGHDVATATWSAS